MPFKNTQIISKIMHEEVMKVQKFDHFAVNNENLDNVMFTDSQKSLGLMDQDKNVKNHNSKKHFRLKVVKRPKPKKN